jgi:hypothetical protein
MTFKTILLTASAAGVLAGLALTDARAGGITSGCQGGFCIEAEDGDELKMFNDDANKDVDHFFGSVHGNGKPFFTSDITINTVGNVNTGSGYANIKPLKDGILSSVTYTVNPIGHLLSDPIPANDVKNFFDGFFTRAQIGGGGDECAKKNSSCTAVVEMTVNGTLMFDYTVAANGKDFSTIGFDEFDESKPGSLIQSVTLTLLTSGFVFNEVKQTDWSPCDLTTECGSVVINPTGGVPEPSTWLLGLTGFGFVGGLMLKRSRKGRLATV